MLASFLCNFVLNASSTGLPIECVFCNFGRSVSASSQGNLTLGGSFICIGDSVASKKICRRSSRLERAAATSGDSEPFSDAKHAFALLKTSRTAFVEKRSRRVRLYVFGTKSSSCEGSISICCSPQI